MKKVISLFLCVLMLASVIIGCGNQSIGADTGNGAGEAKTETNAPEKSEEAKEKPVTITIGGWPIETDTSAVKKTETYVQTMKGKYPLITIKGDEWVYDVNSFLPKAESGQLPNIFETWFTETKKIIDAGYAADITEAMKANGYLNAMNPDMLKLMEKNGKYYGIPYEGYAMGMMYNINLFKEAGLLDEQGIPKFPGTYQELAETGRIIKEKTGKAGFFFPTKNNQGGWQFMNIAWSYGAEFEKLVDGKWQAVFNSPEAIEALQYLKDLKWKYDILTDNILVEVSDMFKMFGTDQVAMAFGMAGWENEMINSYKMSKDNVAMSAMPEGSRGNVTLIGGGLHMFASNSTPEQIDAGFKWLKVTGVSPETSQEALKGFEESLKSDYDAGRAVGPQGLKIWINPERISAEDSIRAKYTNVNMDLWNDYINNTSKLLKPEEPINCQELYKTLDSVVQAVLTDEKADPKALLDKAAADFQRDYLDKVN